MLPLHDPFIEIESDQSSVYEPNDVPVSLEGLARPLMAGETPIAKSLLAVQVLFEDLGPKFAATFTNGGNIASWLSRNPGAIFNTLRKGPLGTKRLVAFIAEIDSTIQALNVAKTADAPTASSEALYTAVNELLLGLRMFLQMIKDMPITDFIKLGLRFSSKQKRFELIKQYLPKIITVLNVLNPQDHQLILSNEDWQLIEDYVTGVITIKTVTITEDRGTIEHSVVSLANTKSLESEAVASRNATYQAQYQSLMQRLNHSTSIGAMQKNKDISNVMTTMSSHLVRMTKHILDIMDPRVAHLKSGQELGPLLSPGAEQLIDHIICSENTINSTSHLISVGRNDTDEEAVVEVTSTTPITQRLALAFNRLGIWKTVLDELQITPTKTLREDAQCMMDVTRVATIQSTAQDFINNRSLWQRIVDFCLGRRGQINHLYQAAETLNGSNIAAFTGLLRNYAAHNGRIAHFAPAILGVISAQQEAFGRERAAIKARMKKIEAYRKTLNAKLAEIEQNFDACQQHITVQKVGDKENPQKTYGGLLEGLLSYYQKLTVTNRNKLVTAIEALLKPEQDLKEAELQPLLQSIASYCLSAAQFKDSFIKLGRKPVGFYNTNVKEISAFQATLTAPTLPEILNAFANEKARTSEIVIPIAADGKHLEKLRKLSV